MRLGAKSAIAWLVRGLTWRLLRAVQTEQERRVAEWHAMDVDDQLRLRYPLNEDSVVLDIGGYTGQWASDIVAMYRCTVHVYEPIPAFARHVADRFAANPSIVVHGEGIASSTRNETLYLDDEASGIASLTQQSRRSATQVSMRSVIEAIDGLGTHRIDLLKLNIEGAEYEVLECILDAGYMDRISHLQVQFHDFAPGAAGRREVIQGRLRRTHSLSYCVPFVWESWEPMRETVAHAPQ